MPRANPIADRYDRIASSAPVNTQAARAFSMSGEREAEREFNGCAHWETPPRMGPLPLGQPHFIDLTGRRFGSLTIVGYLTQSGLTARWVARCLCGRYEPRTTRAVKNAHPDDGCQRCKHLRGLQKAERERRRVSPERAGTMTAPTVVPGERPREPNLSSAETTP